VKAIACELVCRTDKPLSRQSLAGLTTQASQELGKLSSIMIVAALFSTSRHVTSGVAL
jgi:hypothetical protein